MLYSGGSLSIFWSNALVGSIMGLAILLLLWPILSKGVGFLFGRGSAAGTR